MNLSVSVNDLALLGERHAHITIKFKSIPVYTTCVCTLYNIGTYQHIDEYSVKESEITIKVSIKFNVFNSWMHATVYCITIFDS